MRAKRLALVAAACLAAASARRDKHVREGEVVVIHVGKTCGASRRVATSRGPSLDLAERDAVVGRGDAESSAATPRRPHRPRRLRVVRDDDAVTTRPPGKGTLEGAVHH